jgi:hypothetical protein
MGIKTEVGMPRIIGPSSIWVFIIVYLTICMFDFAVYLPRWLALLGTFNQLLRMSWLGCISYFPKHRVNPNVMV